MSNRVTCPNCRNRVPGLVIHECNRPRFGCWVAFQHCGCFYDEAPSLVKHHVRRDCLCSLEER